MNMFMNNMLCLCMSLTLKQLSHNLQAKRWNSVTGNNQHLGLLNGCAWRVLHVKGM